VFFLNGKQAVFLLRVVALACIISATETAETAEFFSQMR